MSSLNKKQKNNNDDNNNDEVPKGLGDLLGNDPVIKTLNDFMGNARRTFLVQIEIYASRTAANRRSNRAYTFGENINLFFRVQPLYIFQSKPKFEKDGSTPVLDDDGNQVTEQINTGTRIPSGDIKNIHKTVLNAIGDIICRLKGTRNLPFVQNDSPRGNQNRMHPGEMRPTLNPPMPNIDVVLYNNDQRPPSYITLRGATVAMYIYYRNILRDELSILAAENINRTYNSRKYVQSYPNLFTQDTLMVFNYNDIKCDYTFTDTFATVFGCRLSEDRKNIIGLKDENDSFHQKIMNISNELNFDVSIHDFHFHSDRPIPSDRCMNMKFPHIDIIYQFVPRNNNTPISRSLTENGIKFLKF